MAKQQSLPLGTALGIGIGAVIGFAKNELTFYLVIGLVVGVAMSVIVDQRNMVNREVKKGEQERKKDNIIPKF